MAFSPDGRYLACGGHFHAVFVWDVATSRLVCAPLPQGGMILDIAFAPDGQSLAVGTWAHEARVLDLTTHQLRFPALRHSEVVLRALFSPDNRKLLTICPSSAFLWDAHSGAKLAAMPFKAIPEEMHTHVRGLFGPNGKTILLSSGFGSFRLWDAGAGQPLGPPTPLRAAQRTYFDFSPSGETVVAGYADGTSQLWDVATMKPVGAPMDQPLPIIGVAFQPAGESYWTVANDGTIRSWPVPRAQEGDVEAIGRALELTTGRRFDKAGSVVALSERAWNERAQRWRQENGPAVWGLGSPVPELAWHEARALDAQETGAPYTARWHLDRLIAAHPDDWRLYARRARTRAAEGQWQLAEADYDRAHQHGANEGLYDWFEHEAVLSEGNGQITSALWYLDRALAHRPKSAGLHERRAGLLAVMGKSSERWAELRKAIESGSGTVLLCRLACEKAAQGQWQDAVEFYGRARRQGPLPSPHGSLYALACLKANDGAGYRALCADLVMEAGLAVPDHYISAEEVLAILVLAPNALEDYTVALALAERLTGAVGRNLAETEAPSANPQTARDRNSRLGILGAVLYRAGRYQQARQRLQEAVEAHGDGGEFDDWALLCMVNCRLGKKVEAQRWFEKMMAKQKEASTGFSGDAIANDLWRREAESLLGQQQ
jgi:tetratricopeptide (TPR) repeat protein